MAAQWQGFVPDKRRPVLIHTPRRYMRCRTLDAKYGLDFAGSRTSLGPPDDCKNVSHQSGCQNTRPEQGVDVNHAAGDELGAELLQSREAEDMIETPDHMP